MRRFLEVFSAVMAAPAAVLILSLNVMPVFAQELNPCTDDFKQYCGSVTPGRGRLLQCYEQNKNRMSADCVGWAETAKNSGKALRNACADMLDARCRSEEGDPFAMIDCLQSNYIDLKPKCVQKLNEFKGRYPKPVQ